MTTKFKNGLAKHSSGTYHYCLRINGRQYKGSTQATDLQTARKVLEERRRQFLQTDCGIQKVPTLSEVREVWLRSHKAVHSPKHWQEVATVSRLWLMPKVGTRPVDRITSGDVLMLRSRMLEAGRAPVTVNNMLKVLKLLVNFALKQGHIKALPFKVEFLRFQKKPRPVLSAGLLPGGRVSIGLDISKRPHAFEGIYHTSASQVVDVLCIALDQITQGGFGTVSSGSPKWQKDRAVEGWQLYLGHTSRWRQVLAGDALPVLAADPPKDLLGTFKVTPFQKVDRLEGLPEPVQDAIHDLFKRKCDALLERMTGGSRDELEKDPDWAAMSEQEKQDFFVFDTPGIANPGEKWTAGDAIPRSMLHRPRRRLIFGGTSPSLWFMYYDHGGIGRHQHLLVIGKGDTGGHWLRWVKNTDLGEKGIGMTRLKRLASGGRLATSEEDTGE